MIEKKGVAVKINVDEIESKSEFENRLSEELDLNFEERLQQKKISNILRVVLQKLDGNN